MSAIGANASGQASRLRPYLTTAQLISLAAFAAPIISLLFILFRIRASSDTAQRSIDEAKNSLQASCLAAERAASVGASLPRYLAQGVNEQITDGVRATMEGVRIGLTLSLTVTEAIIEFIIDMYRSTFLCLLELVIRGGLSVVIASVQEITSFVNTTLSSITAGIAGDVQSANNVIQTAVNAIKNIPFVGNNINIPQISIPSAAQLSSIQIPTTFEDRLKSLNSTLPTLDQLRDKLDAVISIPFELVKKEINETFAASQASFIATPLPVPKEATVSFCGDTISTSFDDLAKTLIRVAQIGIAVVIGCMVLLFFAYAFVTWWSQRSLRQNIERIKVLWFGDGNATTDRLLAFDALISHPIWSRIVQFLAEKYRLSQEKYDALTWFGLYVFHPAPMACLLIGIFGLISVQIQLAIIPIMTNGFSNQAANDVSNLSTKIATKLNETMWQDSVAYAQSLNKQIGSVQDTINNDVFGWVNATIIPLNNTIATFYSEVQDAVKTVFGNTPLDAPAQEFIRCLIGSKVSGIENALTFLQKNLNVDLPRVDEGALVLSQSGVNEVAAPISAAAVGSGNNGEDGGFVGKIITQYIKALEKERITFFIFLLLWAFVVMVAFVIIAWHFLILPAIHKRGMREPRWLAGPRWEDSITFVPDHEKQPSMEKVGMYNHGPAVVAIPSPLRKNHSVTSTSTKASSHGDHVRQRRAGEGQETSDMRSFLDAHPTESEQGTFIGRLKRFTTIGRNTHTAKKNSDDGIIPVANHNVSRARPSNPRTNAGTQWFERLTIWGGGSSEVEPSATEPPKEPSRRRALSNHGLTVDVTKASTQFITPRIILEHDDRPWEPVVVPTPPRPSPPSRSGSGDSSGSRRPGDYLSVPKPGARRQPKPPAWLEAERSKKALPVLPDERPRHHEMDSIKGRQRQNSGSDNDTRRGPRRPPGLGADDERSRHPTYPKPVVTYEPRGRSSQSGGSRHSRNSSVPPTSERIRTDPKRQQQRDQILSRPSSFDTADPFATPVKRTMELPAPLEPVKKNSLPAESSAFANPFSTPFDDSNAVSYKAANTELRSDATYNFSFPTRRLNGAI